MEIGDIVTAEILNGGKPEKIHGVVTNKYNDGGEMYEIKPDGFETLTIPVRPKNVYLTNPPEPEKTLVQPKLNYQKPEVKYKKKTS